MDNLITSCARKVYRQYVAGTDSEHLVSVDDLKHAGAIGYLEANNRFDASRGSDKRIFLGIRVRGAIISWLRNQPLVRMPQGQYGRVKDLREVRSHFMKIGKETSPAAVADFLGWDEEEVHRIDRLQPHVKSLHRSTNDDEGRTSTMLDNFPGNMAQPQDELLEKEIAQLIQLCLENLATDDERVLLHARMREDMKLKQVAAIFGCTPQAVHQRQKKALASMKDCLQQKGWNWESDEY